MSNAKHSPTPWRVAKNLYGTANIIETEGRQIAACARECPSADLDADAKQDEANAAFIVEAVNAYERLVAENARLWERLQKQEVFLCPACGGVCVAEEEEREEAAKEAQAKEPPTCDDCEYCDGGVRAKIIDHDTGETMPWGQCSVHVFCNGDICASFKQKEGAQDG